MAKSEQLHPIFRDCCMAKQQITSRYAMREPFVQQGHWYATDGGIMVRQPTKLSYSDGAVPRDCDEIYALAKPTKKRVKLVPGDYEDRVYPVWMSDGRQLAENYLRILQRHGVTELTVARRKRGMEVPYIFTLGDIEGLVMPCYEGGVGDGQA